MSINSQLFFEINGLTNIVPALDSAMIFSASYLIYVIFAVTLVIVGYLLYRREWKTVLWFLAALALSFIILKITQYIHPGIRPFVAEKGVEQLIDHAPGISFPSDHAAVAAAIAFGVVFITRFKATGWLFIIAALVIGFARIFVGVHYPFDVLAGLATGLVGAGIVGIVHYKLKPRDELMTFDKHSSFKK